MTPVPKHLPYGTVTFLFTDVEGSTKLLHELGAEAYASVLAEHRRLLRDAFAHHGGVEVDTQGDALFYAFPTAPGALEAARDGQEALAPGPIRVRMGIHTGTPHLTAEGYVGADVNKGARIAAAGHGGQVLLSKETSAALDLHVTDLGEHRVKDFDQPVWILQLGSERFPPLKTISNTNLPHPASSFVGREREVSEVIDLLQDGTRLLTLSGPGGTGKTRLAIEAATELVPEFRNGVFWVGLATLTDPALVTDTIAQTLGAKDGIAEHVSERDMLLVLDNLEQVIDVAPELSPLLEACPNLKLLVTSRELLRIDGEVEYAVPPLVETEAIQLFCSRSGLDASTAIAELCRRLDNLPLAVELAAARTSVLSPQKILERLSKSLDLLKAGRGADPRQATLRATIEWSHDLLSEGEQQLFARLAVFRGGCTLEAAEEVVDADLDVLQSLVDKSLVRHTDDRFWMLETIRAYAMERLSQTRSAQGTERRHLEYFLALAERAYGERLGSAAAWFSTFEDEHDNFRAALDRAADKGDEETEAQLAGAVAPYWNEQGHAIEARERLQKAVARYGTRNSVRARVLTQLGEVLGLAGMDREALQYLYEGLDLWREQGDTYEEAETLDGIGYCHVAIEEFEQARRSLEQSLALRRHSGTPELQGRSHAGLCQVLMAAGDIDRLEPMAQELLELSAPLEATSHQAARTAQSGLHYLADCSLVRGDYAEASRRYARALAHARDSQLDAFATSELVGFAMATAGEGNHDSALRLAVSAYKHFEDLGIWPTAPFWDRLQERFIGGARDALGPEGAEEAERAGRAMPFETVLDEVVATGAVDAS